LIASNENTPTINANRLGSRAINITSFVEPPIVTKSANAADARNTTTVKIESAEM
jgi:hypothetical protein